MRVQIEAHLPLDDAIDQQTDNRQHGQGRNPFRLLEPHGSDSRGILDPVWPKNSCSFTFVVFEEASNPFTTSNRAGTVRVLADGRKEEHVGLALVIPLVMKVLHVLRQRMTE
jgi:hypothetical protein